jgi:hypothetical protein
MGKLVRQFVSSARGHEFKTLELLYFSYFI